MIKVTGSEWAEWEEFSNNNWNDDWELFDEEIKVNGVHCDDFPGIVAQGDIVTLKGGEIAWRDVKPPARTYEGWLKKWLKARSEVTLIVKAPRDLADAIASAVVAAGGKVAK